MIVLSYSNFKLSSFIFQNWRTVFIFAGFPKFVCNNGRYVPVNQRCDGVDHCGDGSDEISCLNCTNGSFHCVAAAQCVSARSICDGKLDCSDGADEQLDACASLSKPQTCARSEFRCANGHCVPSSWRCDHSPDCEDRSDEENCGELHFYFCWIYTALLFLLYILIVKSIPPLIKMLEFIIFYIEFL